MIENFCPEAWLDAGITLPTENPSMRLGSYG